MKTYTIYSAKTHLSSLIEQVCAGEEIVIARGKVPLVRLVPFNAPAKERKFGAMRGRAKVTDAFFEPLAEGELQGVILQPLLAMIRSRYPIFRFHRTSSLCEPRRTSCNTTLFGLR